MNRDTIYRQAAIDLVRDVCDAIMSGCESYYDTETGDEVYKDIREVDAVLKCNKEIRIALKNLPSAQHEPSEITDEQAILHLQSTGWMQNHDREMYESGLRERLADDSGSYDSLIPCEDTISRKDAIDATQGIGRLATLPDNDAVIRMSAVEYVLFNLPSAQSEQRWIPCSERLPYAEYGESDNVLTTCGYRNVEDRSVRWIKTLYFDGGNWCYPTGEPYEEKVYAWMPLPEPYQEGE